MSNTTWLSDAVGRFEFRRPVPGGNWEADQCPFPYQERFATDDR
jgi:hypothetical protein